MAGTASSSELIMINPRSSNQVRNSGTRSGGPKHQAGELDVSSGNSDTGREANAQRRGSGMGQAARLRICEIFKGD
jgi:hypothetical protein